MNRILLVVAFFFAVLESSANAEPIAPVFKAVVYLIAEPDKDKSDAGTGFFVAQDQPPLRDEVPFLITAAHIAKALTANSLGVVQAGDGTAFLFKLSSLVGGKSELRWRYHATEDLAVLKLNPTQDILPQLSGRFFSTQVLRSAKSAPSLEAPLRIIGFPLRAGLAGKFSPISRETKASSDLLEMRLDGMQQPAIFFTTQDPSVQGYSGAPVVDTGAPRRTDNADIAIGFKFEVVGIVNGTYSDNTGGKLGMITPAYFIIDLLNAEMTQK